MSSPQVESAVKQALLEKLRQEIVPHLEQLVRDLPEDLIDFGQAETKLRDGMIGLAGHILDLWGHTANLKVTRPCCPRCGVPMRHRGLVEANVLTTVGEVSYRRPRWRCETCGEESYPHDDILRFFNHHVSWPLAKVCSRLSAQLPSFEEARDNLKEDYGVVLAKETVREIAEAAGTKVLEQEHAYRERVMERVEPLPESEKMPEKAHIFADGTTVHSEGDWHEIRVITVATEDQAGNPLERESRAEFMEVEEVAWSLLLLARTLGYQNAKQKAFVADGAAWLWKMQETYFPSAEPILDWYHLAEKVHAAGNALHGQGTQDATAWSTEIKTALWEGRVAEMIPRVREEYSRLRAPHKREKMYDLLTYLENNCQHMDYPRYRAMGLPIGSGQVEAQCKTLVGGRCKQAGMRNWTYEGAEAILRLRAAKQNKGFDKLWARRLCLAA
jgi:hypothetical protein